MVKGGNGEDVIVRDEEDLTEQKNQMKKTKGRRR